MAYNQHYDSQNGHPPPKPRQEAYNEYQQYGGERSNHPEQSPTNRQYDTYDHEFMQQRQEYAHPRNNGYGRHREYDGGRRNGGPPRDGHGDLRSPPLEYQNGENYGDPKSQPAQYHQQRPVNLRNRRRPNAPMPQQSNNQYPLDRAQDRNLRQKSRPQYDNYSAPDYHPVETDYGGRSDYDDPRRRNPQQDTYAHNNDWQQQPHRRGRSNGQKEQGANYLREAVPANAHNGVSAQKPSREQQRSRSHGRQNLDRREIFDDSTPPDTVAWDNPFPTFPAAKKKGMQSEVNNADSPVADMRTNDGFRSAPSLRPQAADNRIRASKERPQNGHYEPQPRFQPPNWNIHEATQMPPNIQEAPLPEIEGPYVNSNRPRPSTVSRSEEAAWGGPKPSAAFQPDAGRSRTMPDHVSSAASKSDFRKQYGGSSRWQQQPGAIGGYFGPKDTSYIQDRPSTASGPRPVGPVRSRSNEIPRLHDNQILLQKSNGVAQSTHNRPPVSRQDSIAEVYDSYYDGSTPASPDQSSRSYKAYQPPIDEEVPKFDASPATSPGHHRGMTIDEHLQPQQSSPAIPPMPSQHQRQHPAASDHGQAQALRSRSQPDLKNRRTPRVTPNDGFDFGLAPEGHDMPPRAYDDGYTYPSRQYPPEGPYDIPGYDRLEYDRQQGAFKENPRQPPAPYQSNGGPMPAEPYPQPSSRAPLPQPRPPIQQKSSPNNNPTRPDGRPSPDARAGPASPRPSFPMKSDALPAHPAPARGSPNPPPPSFPMQPDALPSHPAPVRAGLMSSSSPNQPPKPVPVRNYNSNNSPLHNFSPARTSSSSRPAEERRAPAPVTQDELDRLRQTMKSNHSDQRTQMTLAKKLVEAAAALDEGVPRLDQKTIQKTRERYYAEAHKVVKRLVSTGYGDGMFFLGDCYSQGRLGLERDSKEAFTLYQAAAKAGHAQAAFRVAVCCELGLEEDGGTKRDLGKAVQWYKRAAQLGDTPAMYKIGVIQLKGLLGQPKDAGEAVVWLRRAAEKADKDNPHALHELVSP